MKTVQALENSNILLKVMTETMENETIYQEGGFFRKVSRCSRS